MSFQALLVSKDDATVAVLEPVLASFDLSVQACGHPDALCKLTEQKFDAVVVDFDDANDAALVLQNASEATSGGGTVTVALLSDRTKVRSALGSGAKFILYKPVASEQAQTSLRAAAALMKRERRRSFRVAAQVPVQLHVHEGADLEGIILDISEDGMELLTSQSLATDANVNVKFSLPGVDSEFDLHSQVAWANPNGQAGMRLVNLPEKTRLVLKDWVAGHATEPPPEDPAPVTKCRLTDLSLGGCYVETESPFSERSSIMLCLKAGEMEVQVEGLVRVMHPNFGMGIEFASRTAEQREHVSNFIQVLASSPGTQPELQITPRALTVPVPDVHGLEPNPEEIDDSLLELLRGHELLTQEEFLQKLRQQRSSEPVAT